MSSVELSSCCSCHVFRQYVCRETSKMFCHFAITHFENNSNFSFSVNGSITAILLHFWRHRSNMTKFFQIWSTVAGYDELHVWLLPIRNGEIFWINNNDYYPEVHPFEDMNVEGLIDYGDYVLPQQQKQLVPKSPSYKETLQGSFKRKKKQI